MRYYFNDQLYFYRFPRIFDIKYENENIPDNYIMIKNYIKDKNDSVTKKELFNYFVKQIGWKEYAVYNNLRKNDDIIHLGNNRYTHIDNFNFDEEVLYEILNSIKSNLNSNMPEIKVDNIYDNNIIKMKKANIKNKNFLLGLLKYYFRDELDFRGTYISNSGMDKTIEDRISNFISSFSNSVFKEEILKEFNEYYLTQEQLYHILYKSDNIIKYDTNEYIHIDNLNIKEEIQELLDIVDDSIELNTYNLASITNDIVPKIENDWTEDLIVDILKRTNRYYFLGTNINKYVIINKDNDNNISDNISFLNYLLSEKYNGYVEKKELKKYLSKIGFIVKNLPQEFKTNNEDYPYYIENDEIILKDFDTIKGDK